MLLTPSRLALVIAGALFGVFLILAVIVVIFVICKSRRHVKARITRQISIRASIRSIRQTLYGPSPSETPSCARKPPLSKVKAGKLELYGATLEDSTTDTSDKAHIFTENRDVSTHCSRGSSKSSSHSSTRLHDDNRHDNERSVNLSDGVNLCQASDDYVTGESANQMIGNRGTIDCSDEICILSNGLDNEGFDDSLLDRMLSPQWRTGRADDQSQWRNRRADDQSGSGKLTHRQASIERKQPPETTADESES